MSASAFEDYLAQWREASPQRALAWLFLRHDERICFGALAALQHEWHKALRGVGEPQVAAAKLGWWREEMQHAVQGEARHPLTRGLFADARANAVPLAFWTAPVEAAIAELEAPPSADFAAQCDRAAPLATAGAELETRVWFGVGADSPRAARVMLFADLTCRLRALADEVQRGRSPLPMNLLARHGLTIEGLCGDGPARRAALHDQLVELERSLAAAAAMPGPLGLFRAVDLQHDLAALRVAVRARDPLPALRGPAHGIRSVLKTWRAARTWRNMSPIESHP
ncbi:MAG TPA: squalene/phytoene synthase family protein [Rhodanobacteraceae bacterium]|nr:squalene/phytoene synthase family protein [Rhodanobacteraceae bacterium]